MPAFYASECPVFSCGWLGDRSEKKETGALIIYSGGGGATKSGVLNKLVVARVEKTDGSAHPSFAEVSSISTDDDICTTTAHDAPRGKVQLIAGGLGRRLVFYGFGASQEILQLNDGVKCAGNTGDQSSEVMCVAFEKKWGKVVATGDETGLVRIFTLENAEAVIAALASKPPPESQVADAAVGGAAEPVGEPIPRLALSAMVVELKGHSGAITSLDFDSQGKRVSAGHLQASPISSHTCDRCFDG